MRRLADFHRNEQLDGLDSTLAVTGVQAMNGRRAFVLQGTLPTRRSSGCISTPRVGSSYAA